MRSLRSKLLTITAVGTLTGILLAGPKPAVATSGEYMVVWAGAWNASDHSSGDLKPGNGNALAAQAGSNVPGPDFLAVLDVDPSSSSYGKIVRTFPVPGVDAFENEPHHMQYAWHHGDPIYAGGLFSARTFVFDVTRIPDISLTGTVEPADTPCGTVPDAYWVLHDGSAYGTYMGGPAIAGDPRCNGGFNNGFAGTPGEVVHISPQAKVLGEYSAAGAFNAPWPADAARPNRCVSNPPLPRPSCANPHGIQAREDLGVMVTADYAEPRNVPIDPATQVNPNVFRDTVRVWNIQNLNDPKLISVSPMPVGSMGFLPPSQVDAKGVMGIMETTVTNLPGHKGAFASSMCGGQIFYSDDITVANPMWRQVFDANTAAISLDPNVGRIKGCVGAGWLQTSPDDSLLFQAVIGRSPGTLGADDPGVPKMLYALDIRNLVAIPPSSWNQDNLSVCTISTDYEVYHGGDPAKGCPHLTGAVPIADSSSGGPHWGAIDNFHLSPDPGRISSVTRIASSDYFVARSGLDGNHRVCMINVSATGALSLDTTFQDENTHAACVDFNRTHWPHGDYGIAKPHSLLFVTP